MNEKSGGNPEDHEPSLRGQVRALTADIKGRDRRLDEQEQRLGELRMEVEQLKRGIARPQSG